MMVNCSAFQPTTWKLIQLRKRILNGSSPQVLITWWKQVSVWLLCPGHQVSPDLNQGDNPVTEVKQSFTWELLIRVHSSFGGMCSLELYNQPAPIHAMKLLLLNQTRILICLDYYHNIKYFLIDNSSMTEVEGPVADYGDILHGWNYEQEYPEVYSNDTSY